MTNERLTVQQLTRAHALASAYHHLWADAPLETYLALLSPEQTITPDDIRRVSATLDCGPVPGIDAPSLDADGDVLHVSGSGRLEWTISPTGDTRLAIRRPDPQDPRGAGYVVIVADVSGQGDTLTLEDDSWPATPSAYEHTFSRHFLALKGAVLATGIPEARFTAAYAPAWELIAANEVRDAEAAYNAVKRDMQRLIQRPGGHVLAQHLAAHAVKCATQNTCSFTDRHLEDLSFHIRQL